MDDNNNKNITQIQKINNKIRGKLFTLIGDVICGYAFDPANPDERLIVEIYINNSFITAVRADLEEYNNVETNDNFHGFTVVLPKKWLNIERICISAKIANTNIWLDNNINRNNTANNINIIPFYSQVWNSGGLVISGWYWNPTKQNIKVKAIIIDEFNNEIILDECIANRPQHDFIHINNPKFGFILNLPISLADGNTHEIFVKEENGNNLIGSPIYVCCNVNGTDYLFNQIIKEKSKNAQDKNSIELLKKLFAQQNKVAPVSVGFKHYDNWYRLFNNSKFFTDTSINPVDSNDKVLILIIGENNKEKQQVSIQSLSKQENFNPKNIVIIYVENESNDIDNYVRRLTYLVNDHNLKVIIPLNAGDILSSKAVYTYLRCFTEYSKLDIIYSDNDEIDIFHEKHENFFGKPAWDETLFYGIDYLTNGIAISIRAIKRALDYLAKNKVQLLANWHTLLCATISITNASDIGHLPFVLYHKNKDNDYNNRIVSQSRLDALNWLSNLPHKLGNDLEKAEVSILPKFSHLTKIRFIPKKFPKISLIIPTKDKLNYLKKCIYSLVGNTNYPDFVNNVEIVIVDNNSVEFKTKQWLNFIRIRYSNIKIIDYNKPFNYSAIHNYIVQNNFVSNEIIGLINNDIEVIENEPNWLIEMVTNLLRPNVGIVGAKLLWQNQIVQHAGVIIGVNGLAAHIGNYWNDNEEGYFGINQINRELSSVTAACLLIRKEHYLQLNGMEENLFPIAFNDVDLCLRLQQQLKLKVIWCAFAKLIHAESASRGKEDTAFKFARAKREQQNFIQRWSADQPYGDIYYNPNLNLDSIASVYNALALPPRNNHTVRINNILCTKKIY